MPGLLLGLRLSRTFSCRSSILTWIDHIGSISSSHPQKQLCSRHVLTSGGGTGSPLLHTALRFYSSLSEQALFLLKPPAEFCFDGIAGSSGPR